MSKFQIPVLLSDYTLLQQTCTNNHVHVRFPGGRIYVSPEKNRTNQEQNRTEQTLVESILEIH